MRKLLGTGQLSQVYLAEDTRANNDFVAVKLLETQHPDALRQEFFRRETSALGRLDHPNIIQLLNSGYDSHNNAFFVVLEYVEGSLLEEMDRQRNNPDWSWCIPIARKLADAIVHAHSEGVIHRDIKPANVLINSTGEPKLCDFGISRLKNELSVGMTVGAFWTAGYASPEQQIGNPGTEACDVYALGAVLYHLLSGSAPISAGPSGDDIAALSVSGDLRALLGDMLNVDPTERPTDTQVLRRIAAIDSQTARTPEVLVEVTGKVVKELYEYGFIADIDVEAAKEWLRQEMGGDHLKPVSASLASPGRQDVNRIEILGDHNIAILLTRHRTYPALAAVAIHLVYDATLEVRRQHFASVQRDWAPLSKNDLMRQVHPSELDTLTRAVDDLYDELASFASKKSTEKERDIERRGLVDDWRKVLNFQQERLQREDAGLSYVHVEPAPESFRFILQGPIPDELEWTEGTPLAIWNPKVGNPLQVGDLVSAQGNELWVARSHTSKWKLADLGDIPAIGQLRPYEFEIASLLTRQRNAIKAIEKGTTANPRLSDILIDVKRARFDSTPSTSNHIVRLTEDKQHAVKRALSARDLFLIKGPPGTGKTTAIVALIREILLADPQAKILVSSQSNIAVNHVLEGLSAFLDSHRIVRIGREDKIGQGAEEFTLGKQLARWRQEVLGRCDVALDELTPTSDSHVALDDQTRTRVSDLEDCLEWLAECDAWLDEIEMNEALLQAFVATTRRSSDEIEADPKVVNRRSDIAHGRAAVIGHLKTIHSLLPEQREVDVHAGDRAEVEQMRSMIAEGIERLSLGDTAWERRALIREWKEVVGHQREFEALLLERANVVGATCVYSGGRDLRNLTFDWVIIDEAGRATAPELLIPLTRGRRAVLVGDENQLPPMLDDDISPEWVASQGMDIEDLEESLFETLVKHAEHECPNALATLVSQHRMHPGIGGMISDVFYDGQLQHGVTAEERAHGIDWIESPILWLSTSASSQRLENRRGASYENLLECDAIVRMLERIESRQESREQRRELGIISGYAAQTQTLNARIQPTRNDRWPSLEIEVATVDAFQGRDRDIIIYSAVRSNPESNIGFMRDRRRLNVALSRARQLLVVVGDIDMLEKATTPGDNPFAKVIQYMRAHPETCAVWDTQDLFGSVDD